MADEAVRQGRVTIQDASDYFAWASCTQGAVKYVFVSKEQCEETQNAMKTLILSPMKRTIKIHSVFGLNENKIAVEMPPSFVKIATRMVYLVDSVMDGSIIQSV
jgi:hypothetical protein